MPVNVLNINELYKCVHDGDNQAEKKLFEGLSARFHVFARHRINDIDDIEDVVQDTLMIISREYKSMTFTVSFSAWAYKVLVNRILVYHQKKKVRADRLERIPDSESQIGRDVLVQNQKVLLAKLHHRRDHDGLGYRREHE